jgi:anthranilate/para-aminobenzoate synthase component I
VHGGGGITIGSEPEAERQETLAKVAAFCAPGQGPEIS